MFVLLAAVTVWWAWPKSQPLDLHPSVIGYYRGLGLTDEPNLLLGKSYYLVVWPYEDGGHCEIRYQRPGYNRFKGFYENGRVREEGECFVEIMGFDDQPSPDLHNVLWGNYYTPDGSLASSIRDSTGVQTYWTEDSTKTWELELRDFKRLRLTAWYPNGQLVHEQHYVEGKRDGAFVSYYSSGTKKTEGAYCAGERTGKWVRYNENGSVRKVEEYSDSETDRGGCAE